MKYIRDLSEEGKIFVMEQLSRRMKRENDLIEQGCYDDVMQIVTHEHEDYWYYELSCCETKSGMTELVEFEEHHFEWDRD